MDKHNWQYVALLACCALAGEAYIGFGLGFAPGWANGWPGGLSIRVVWPAGMTTIAAAMLMTTLVALGAALAVGYQYLSRKPPSRWAVWVWLAASVVGTAVAAPYLFAFLRAEALVLWPAG